MYSMTKIAHIEREHEQDVSVSERKNEKLTRVARATVEAGADAERKSAQRVTEAADDLYEASRKSAEESTEIGQVLLGLVEEQTRQSMDTWTVFARSVNWAEVAQAQSKLFADSLLRISQFNVRYREFFLRGMTLAATSPRR
jgi:hypothetical protein